MYKYLKGRCKEGRARLFSVSSSDRTRGNGRKLKSTKFNLNARKHFCAVKMVKALVQVAQRGVGVSILGGIKNVTGNRAEQCALLDPALSKETGLNDLQRSLPTSTIL